MKIVQLFSSTWIPHIFNFKLFLLCYATAFSIAYSCEHLREVTVQPDVLIPASKNSFITLPYGSIRQWARVKAIQQEEGQTTVGGIIPQAHRTFFFEYNRIFNGFWEKYFYLKLQTYCTVHCNPRINSIHERITLISLVCKRSKHESQYLTFDLDIFKIPVMWQSCII